MSTLYNLQKRIFLVLVSIVIFRIGSFIPIPGINAEVLKKVIFQNHSSFLSTFNMLSGGSLNRASIFALGVMPYISASIIIQLFTLIIPHFIALKQDGTAGKKKLSQYTKYMAFFISLIQSIGVVVSLPSLSGMKDIILCPDRYFYTSAITSLVTGTVFLMWLGEFITEKGLGNGVSLIVCSGIVSNLPLSCTQTLEIIRKNHFNVLYILSILFIIFFVTFIVVFIERSQRKIVVCYARRQQGMRMYSAHNSYLPLKLNMAGVVPVIFSSSCVLLASLIFAYYRYIFGNSILFNRLFLFFQLHSSISIVANAGLIIFFCFFYTGVVFDVNETSTNLKKSGAFVPGIRPGIKTAEYINKIVSRLTALGAIYTVFLCLLPNIMRSFLKVPFYFGGTSLLIIVAVLMEFIAQAQTLMMSTQYKKILKKANLYSRS
ncbi:preprotein translocase subunit SecY [Buchnera aphidicola]|uniref:preprotein translocase subunit SecY n=1 Tax=Buchnera aphidicola TaxID=9 RepID=UPI00094C2AA7|nr:preprotein translocase subunit SecY [Buchnera aphidicola]